MVRRFGFLVVALMSLNIWALPCAGAREPIVPRAIVCPANTSFAERLAAKEIRRYMYLRSGNLVPIVAEIQPGEDIGQIVVGCKSRPAVKALLVDDKLKTSVEGLGSEQYLLAAIRDPHRPMQLVAGGDPIGTLYGAYRLAEHLGMRFYMHGDVVPDRPAPFKMPAVDEQGKPLFRRRGIQPFHDFPEGPDWWDADGYKAILGQLPKMRMNFFGLHTYPQGGVGPEPTTWIGVADDIGQGPKVKSSYPSRHFTTANPTGAWGYRPMKTGDYSFGAAAIYQRDDFGPDYMQGMQPFNKLPPEQCNELFQRFGTLLGDVFGFARRVGVKTCIGTETPLVIPTPVQARLRAAGKDPKDPAVVREVYQGMFRRIMQTHPLDYYWLWTPEGWTWGKVSQKQIDATLADFKAVIAAARQANAPFTLATCGWVLGPPQNPSLFDDVLPKDMPMSCINRNVGHAAVEAGFAKVEGRPQWAIPWMEDDPAMIIPQLWVGRMRKDAADARKYGCTGLMGIHWRTRELGPNVSALAHAAWDQSGWNPEFGRQQPAAAAATPEGAVGGQIARFPDNPIAGTEDDPLYQTVRYNLDGYRIKVPNGTYTVTLKFCEPHYAEKGKRVFGAKIQGKQVIDRLDIFQRVGQNKVLDFSFEDVAVKNGRLTIDFVRIVEFPCIAAIVVEGPKASRKINCGGQAHGDFQADIASADIHSPRASRDVYRPERYLPREDFYADWALSQFGPEAAEEIAAVFAKIDCRLPRPSTWVGGPGGIRPDARPWTEVAKQYAFVNQLAALRPKLKGPGNLERFDYWLDQFRYLRSVAEVNCTWHRLNAAMNQVKGQKDATARKKLAREIALPIRRELIGLVADVHRHLLSSVTTPGAMGNVTNWQQHVMPMLLGPSQKDLTSILGGPLPAEAMPSKQYQGPPRLFMPVVRTALVTGEPLRLKAVVLGAKPADAAVIWRPLGSVKFTRVALGHVARGVYAATLPAEAVKADFEYYVEIKTAEGGALRFPPTAPKLNQTVVVVDAE